eukprot:6639627-Lingulodinium_polyedra.AAC.1
MRPSPSPRRATFVPLSIWVQRVSASASVMPSVCLCQAAKRRWVSLSTVVSSRNATDVETS